MTFSLPLETVEVGGLRYTTTVGKDWKEGKWGTSDHGDCTISLSENLEAVGAIWHTWLHEWLHCVTDSYGVAWDSEAQIDAMASAVLQLIKQLGAPQLRSLASIDLAPPPAA